MTGLAVGLVLLADAAAAQTMKVPGVQYLDGLPGIGSTTGTLWIENGRLRLDDTQGRPVFERPLAFAEAWTAYEKRTSGGCVVRNIALLPVLLPLAAQYGGDPWAGSCTRNRVVIKVRVGAGPAAPELRLRAGKAQVRSVIDAVNRAAWHGWSPELVPHL